MSNITKWCAEDLNIQGTRMFLLQKILKHIKIQLKDWNKNEFGNIFDGKKIIEGRMQELNQTLIKEGHDKVRSDQATKYQQQWENICKQEEIFWRQKSRVQWLKEGKHNTKFFHKSTMDNRAHNRISLIKDKRGNNLNSHEEIEVALVQHFRSIAQDTCYERDHYIWDFTKHIPRMVSREDNVNLYRSVTKEEVSGVVKEMQNGKAPGPDGFNVNFFKACWNIVKQDILQVVEDSRRRRTILKALNSSFIALIPIQEQTLTPDRFRPIALCNVVYKIISKVVANRLKPLLPSLVSGEQVGYVEGRKILNNIIQAHEVVNSLTSKRKARMIMPLDIGKAYDKMNWNYIRQVLIDFGFDHNWVIPTVKEALAYKQILNDFSMASGMEVNYSKSKIFFFNTNIAIQRNISRILGFQRDSIPSKYLGIPLTEKPLHKSIWESMISKLHDKTRKWTMRSLNLFGRLILTKVVLQLIPIFMLSAIPSSKGILHQMRNIQRDFLWGKGEEKKKWALVSWEKVYKPKNYESLGFDDPEILGKVLGEKLWWRWIKEPKEQWAITWKEKYASSWLDNDCIRMDGNIRGSHIWNKAWDNRGLVQENIFWEIREGDLALFWEDIWQQEPILLQEDLEDLKAKTDTKGLT
eukprot:PITA_25801